MDGRQVSIVCVLLQMTFDPLAAQIRCPTCPEGYFVMKNCSVRSGRIEGVRCQRCTNCSAAAQETLHPCSRFADSLCGNQTSPADTSTATPTALRVSPDLSILSVIVLSLFLLLLLSLFLALLSCRQRQRNKIRAHDLLTEVDLIQIFSLKASGQTAPLRQVQLGT